MRDQYNFLKAIDTSSSSPELKESHRPRKQQPIVASLHNRHHINHLASEAASSSASSNSNQNNNNKNINQTNGRNRAGLIKSKLQNFVRPRRFQLTSSGESKSSSTRQLHQQLHFARQEEDCDDEDTEEEEEQDIDDEEDVENNNPDDSDEEPEEVAAEQLTSELQHRLLSPASPQRLHQIDGDRTKQQQQITQPGVPIVCQIKKRTPSKRTQQMAAAKYREQQQQQLGQYLVNRPAPISRPNAMTTNQFATTNQNQTSISAGTVQAHAAANYNSSENQHQHTTTKQVMASGGRHELAKCYDEIDQIYDYIRGLAPLPANLRKIKAIDFEQIERERQRHKSNQQQQQLAQPAPVDPRQVHHQHRQRYVKSIGSSSQSSSVAPGGCVVHTTSQHHQAVVTPHANGAGANGNGTGIGSMAKKSAKVRQRVVAELIKSQEGAPMKLPAAMSVAPQQQQQATTGRVSSKLRETLQFIVPMPIRVTTKSAESQKPSIKRVESLNLGANGERLLSPQHAPKTTAAAVIQTKPTTTQASHHLQKPVSLNSRPSYLISGAQRGQLFRLPRAHSTSTLNKSTTTPLDQKRPTIIIGGGQQTELKQALKHEPVIQEDFPLVRLAARQSSGHQQQFDPQTGSLGRVGSSNNNKRPSFESDLVESYVDDDDDDEEQEQEEDNDAAGDADSEKVKASNEAKVLSPASRDKHHNSTSSAMAASLKSRSSDRLTGKSSATSSSSGTGGAGAKEEVSKHHHNQTDSSSSDSSSSEEDNDGEDRSASASERWSYADDSSKNQRLADKSHSDYDNDSASETSETTATTTTRTTATTTTTNTSNEEDEEIRQSFGGAARQRSTSSKRSHHNQLRPTTSSSPSSGRPASPVDMANESDEIEMNSGVSHKSSSFASGSRHQQQQREPNGLEARVSRVEHIYEQIPAHKGQDRSNSHRHMVPPITANDHHRQKSQTSGQMKQSSMTPGDPSSGQSMSSPSRRVASRLQPAAATAINHPVAYAANVAANRRYQQQVAALFALQQQRDRNQQLTRRNSRAPSVAQQQHQQQQLGVSPLDAVSYRPNHQRRSSASNSQFISPQPVHHSSPGGGPISLTIGSLKWKHQAARQLADVPHRQRYSMGNIHLISGAAAGIPLASLCSPKSKQHYQHQQLSAKQGGQAKNLLIAPKHHHLHHHHTTAWIDDQEAGSTGTTNSTSSYEAAIKNSEPDPLRIDMICPSDGEQSRQPSSKRSIGSGSGSRSLTNQSHHSMQNNNNSNNNTSIQQTSTLMKVPKLSKQSHLLQRPLPKPPVSSRSYASNTSSSRQPQKLTSASRTTSTSSSQPTKAAPVDVFS